MNAKIPEIVQLLADASQLAPRARFDACETPRDVQLTALRACDPERAAKMENASDSSVAGAFDSLVRSARLKAEQPVGFRESGVFGVAHKAS